MKNLFIIFLGLTFSTCGVYKYEFNNKYSIITSKKKTPISQIWIMASPTKPLAKFTAITGKKTDKFSLIDFSPEYFVNEDNFRFKKNTAYYLQISPIGDRATIPINIYIEEDGKIVQVKE